MSAHVCRESLNPRSVGFCACGRRMAVEAPSTVYRDLFRERAWTMQACLGITDSSDLIEHAERRASSLSSPYVDDPMTLRVGMNRPREVREELLDGRNHLVFLMQERELNADEERDCLIALRHIAMAYDVLRRLA